MTKVQVFAVLKEHFEHSFNLNQRPSTVGEVKGIMVQMNPSSESLLQSCRFAVNDELVNDDFKISDHDVISVLPPASGG